MCPDDKIQLLYQIIEILKKFQDHPNSYFNYSKLIHCLKINPKEGKELLDIIFQFQEIFHSILKESILIQKSKNNTLYLTLADRSELFDYKTLEIHEIQLNKEQTNLLSDIIYYFQHVKIGKGFNIRYNTSVLIQSVKNLQKIHPYFFEHRGNGLIYPTQLAVTLGNQIRSHNRGNRPLTKLTIDNYIIKFI